MAHLNRSSAFTADPVHPEEDNVIRTHQSNSFQEIYDGAVAPKPKNANNGRAPATANQLLPNLPKGRMLHTNQPTITRKLAFMIITTLLHIRVAVCTPSSHCVPTVSIPTRISRHQENYCLLLWLCLFYASPIAAARSHSKISIPGVPTRKCVPNACTRSKAPWYVSPPVLGHLWPQLFQYTPKSRFAKELVEFIDSVENQ